MIENYLKPIIKTIGVAAIYASLTGPVMAKEASEMNTSEKIEYIKTFQSNWLESKGEVVSEYLVELLIFLNDNDLEKHKYLSEEEGERRKKEGLPLVSDIFIESSIIVSGKQYFILMYSSQKNHDIVFKDMGPYGFNIGEKREYVYYESLSEKHNMEDKDLKDIDKIVQDYDNALEHTVRVLKQRYDDKFNPIKQ